MSPPPIRAAKPPFWHTTWRRLVADWQERRWLLDTTTRYLQFASERATEAHYAAWIFSARRLLLLYDEHVSNQLTLALDALARYGRLLEHFASGSMQQRTDDEAHDAHGLQILAVTAPPGPFRFFLCPGRNL